jgi:hypothetical protein
LHGGIAVKPGTAGKANRLFLSRGNDPASDSLRALCERAAIQGTYVAA